VEVVCRVFSTRVVHENHQVDSSHPPGVVAWKGSAVLLFKRYASWVQYDVKSYLLLISQPTAIAY